MELVIVAVLICFVLLGLFNIKRLKWVPTTITKIAIGALLLFFLNLVSGSFGLHVPINIFTTVMVGFCGIPGIIALSSLFLFVI